MFDWWFFLEVVINGLLTGVMYSLVALGFVLIFKASGVFNFAQGAMVLFAALTLVGLIERGSPIWLALILTMVVMIVLAIAVGRSATQPAADGRSPGSHSGSFRPDPPGPPPARTLPLCTQLTQCDLCDILEPRWKLGGMG